MDHSRQQAECRLCSPVNSARSSDFILKVNRKALEVFYVAKQYNINYGFEILATW